MLALHLVCWICKDSTQNLRLNNSIVLSDIFDLLSHVVAYKPWWELIGLEQSFKRRIPVLSQT